ncbi:MAG: MerR family transcriptional regulator [Bacteriovoracaceae bacterium]|nr:MerR family transcriptional regulator [Bacteriovoracaceae bacterium]
MDMNLPLPPKSHFKVEEVCEHTGVKPYVLRFWETEFSQLTPMVGSSGQKLYTHEDIDTVLKIKKLLFDEKLTIELAKGKLQGNITVVQEVATLVVPLTPREAHVQFEEDKGEEIHLAPVTEIVLPTPPVNNERLLMLENTLKIVKERLQENIQRIERTKSRYHW